MKPFPHDPLIPRASWRDIPIQTGHLLAGAAFGVIIVFAGTMFALGWIVGYLG